LWAIWNYYLFFMMNYHFFVCRLGFMLQRLGPL
jgi:hypothetical protein